jgi:arylformamidase
MPVHDISLPIAQSTVVWPGDPPVRIAQSTHLDRGDEATVSHMSISVHTGTHVDAPCHYVRGGSGVEALDLHTLIGPALVVHVPQVRQLAAQLMEGLRIPPGTERLLFRTANSDTGAARVLRKDFVALTLDGAEWLITRGVRLVGVDYLSVALYHVTARVHQVLLGAGVTVVEGLDLAATAPGTYELVCLPIKIAGSDGAPARAILIDRNGPAAQVLRGGTCLCCSPVILAAQKPAWRCSPPTEGPRPPWRNAPFPASNTRAWRQS